jgi:hypothetical protein
MFGAERMLDALRRSRPDWMLAVASDSPHGTFLSFTRDWGRDLWRWTAKHHETEYTAGEDAFVLRLMRRRRSTQGEINSSRPYLFPAEVTPSR